MHSARFSILASTALALILASSVTAGAAPQNAIAPAARDYSTPGSMPKPSATIRPSEDDIRIRGSMPDGNEAAPRFETPTPLAPAAATTPTAPAAPVATAAPEPRIETKADIKANAKPRPEPKPDIRAEGKSTPKPEIKTETKVEPKLETKLAPKPETKTATEFEPKSAARPAATTTRPTIADAAPVPNAASEAQVADKLRILVTSKQYERFIERKTDREAVAALYQKVRDFQPLWAASGGPSERAKDVLDYLKSIEADGLDPKDYPMPKLAVASAQAQAEAELKFTAMLLTYAHHAMTGQINFTRVSPNMDYKLAFDADDVLKKIAASKDLPRTLDSFNPPQPAYKALKAKLAELRSAPEDAAPARIATGPVLRYFRDRRGHETIANDARVPLLRERLGLPAESNDRYSLALANAVAKFQKAHGIQVTGQLNTPTVEAMNGPSRARKIEAILATMERWRWMPRDLGSTYVVLNIPDYFLRVYHDGAEVWKTKVVVGKPDHQTPLLTETMKYITVNPTWNVPQSIIYNELLPIYETSDPQIFERQGLKVERNPDGSIRVYQPPGERNALGQIRFNFPNKFLVYQHDTPERYYFAQEKRAYSHGCMRVQDPLKYAEVLLSYASPRANYTQARIQHMLGGEEQQIDFHTQIPVHVTYQTAFVDEAGKLEFRDDIYGHDATIMSILKSPDRAVADIAIERPADPNFKPTPEQGQKLRSVAGGGSPFALFERLFR